MRVTELELAEVQCPVQLRVIAIFHTSRPVVAVNLRSEEGGKRSSRIRVV